MDILVLNKIYFNFYLFAPNLLFFFFFLTMTTRKFKITFVAPIFNAGFRGRIAKQGKPRDVLVWVL